MKNNITLHILLCGLITAAGTIVAMDNPLAITPQSSPTGSPRNNNNNDETVIIPLLDFSNSPTTISPKKSPRNTVISRENTLRKTIANAQTSPLVSPRDKQIISEVLVEQRNSSQTSLIHSPSVSESNSPRGNSQGSLSTQIPLQQSIVIEKTSSRSSEESSSDSSNAHSSSDSSDKTGALQRRSSRQAIELLKKNFSDSSSEESDKEIDFQETNEQLHGEFVNKLLDNIPCYQAIKITLNHKLHISRTKTETFEMLPASNYVYDIIYADKHGESLVTIKSSQALKETDTHVIVDSGCAIELPRANQDSKSDITKTVNEQKTINNTDNNNNRKKETGEFPSHNGKNPVYTVIGGLTFASFMVLLAYHYNKLPDALMNFFDRIVALSPLRR